MTKLWRAVFALTLSLVSFALIALLLMLFADQHTAEGGNSVLMPSETSPDQQIVTILVDDFEPQPIQGHPFWFHNRLGGERWPMGDEALPTNTKVYWGKGVVTATFPGGADEVGVWTSLNHPLDDRTPISFSSIFPSQIMTKHQGRITGLQIQVVTGTGTLYAQLKCEKSSLCAPPPTQTVKWSENVTLSGGPRVLSFSLPITLGEITNLNWFITGSVGSSVVVDRVEFTATVPYMDTSSRAFLWSYAQLLANWDPESGLTRDHAYYAANQFDNISASGLQAAAAVMAWHRGLISKASAIDIVSKTTQALLDLPRCHGLWPHFTGKVISGTEIITNAEIISGTEWSSIDTTIAALTLLEAREALNLTGTETISVEQVLTGMYAPPLTPTLVLTNGSISHGYTTDTPECAQLRASGQITGFCGCSRSIEPEGEGGWRDFGTESWVVNLGYAATTSNTAVFSHTPPTANGGGFIDELAWLLMPPCSHDRWETGWYTYSQRAVGCQLAYYRCQEAEAADCSCCTDTVCPACQGWIECQDPAANCSCCRDHPCYGPLGLFGLTPAEVPDLSVFTIDVTRTYTDFGVCGEYSSIDGTDLLGHAVIVPHYAGVIASLRLTEAITLWNWIETEGLFTPLNNAESLMFTDEVTSTEGLTCTQIVWNARKGSWELGLQTLGWGRLLAEGNNPLYQGFQDNDMLRRGYVVMCPAACRIFLPIIMKQ